MPPYVLLRVTWQARETCTSEVPVYFSTGRLPCGGRFTGVDFGSESIHEDYRGKRSRLEDLKIGLGKCAVYTVFVEITVSTEYYFCTRWCGHSARYTHTL